MLHLDQRVLIGAQEYRITDFLADDEGRLRAELTQFPPPEITYEQLEDWDGESVLVALEIEDGAVTIVPLRSVRRRKASRLSLSRRRRCKGSSWSSFGRCAVYALATLLIENKARA